MTEDEIRADERKRVVTWLRFMAEEADADSRSAVTLYECNHFLMLSQTLAAVAETLAKKTELPEAPE